MSKVNIMITAKMVGGCYCTQIEVPKLLWLPMDASDPILENALPGHIYDIQIGTDRGGFRQVLPPPFIPKPSLWQRFLSLFSKDDE